MKVYKSQNIKRIKRPKVFEDDSIVFDREYINDFPERENSKLMKEPINEEFRDKSRTLCLKILKSLYVSFLFLNQSTSTAALGYHL